MFLRLRDDLWPGVPAIFCGGGRDSTRVLQQQPNVTGSVLPDEVLSNFQVIRRILPATKHIAIVGGASQVDITYNARVPVLARQVFPGIDIIDLTRMTLADVEARIASLPADTAVMISNFFYDPAGRPVFHPELVAALAPITSAPLFAPGDNAMGKGLVGGQLTHYSWVGARAADLALRVLRGESASAIPVGTARASSLQFDWRELDRWKILIEHLPPGSEILYRPFSVWEHYWWAILLAIAGAGLESILVAVLIFQRRRARDTEAARVQAEMAAALARDEISHLNRVASLGELAASLAHELNQPLSGILNNAEAAARFLDSPKPDLEEIRAAVSDIREDDTRASQIIGRMRQMVKKERAKSEPVDVNTAVRDVLSLLRSAAGLRNVALEFEPAADLMAALTDTVQLRQVIMNLVMNAMEAIGGSGKVVVRTMRGARSNEVEILVSDSGPGVPPELRERVFQAFFTTKENGLGMGLSIISSILTAHGGRITLEKSGAAGLTGATFRVTLSGAVKAAAG
jgi:signal transduction histidine kinase